MKFSFLFSNLSQFLFRTIATSYVEKKTFSFHLIVNLFNCSLVFAIWHLNIFLFDFTVSHFYYHRSPISPPLSHSSKGGFNGRRGRYLIGIVERGVFLVKSVVVEQGDDST